MADLANAFEEGNTFTVSKSDTAEARYKQTEVCGGHDMYVDLFSRLGIRSMRDVNAPLPCAGNGRRATETHPYANIFEEAWSQTKDYL